MAYENPLNKLDSAAGQTIDQVPGILGKPIAETVDKATKKQEPRAPVKKGPAKPKLKDEPTDDDPVA